MPSTPVVPQSDKVLNFYHHKLSWKISEENLKPSGTVYLQLSTKIPGSSSRNPQIPGFAIPHTGGFVVIFRTGIAFHTYWEKDVDKTKISLEASFSIKVDNDSTVNIVSDKLIRGEHKDGLYGWVGINKSVNINLETLYDTERFISVEADLKVVREETNGEERSALCEFLVDKE
jgi:hypothetical protein